MEKEQCLIPRSVGFAALCYLSFVSSTLPSLFFFFSGWKIPQAKTFLSGLHSFLIQTKNSLVVLNWFMKKTNQAVMQSNFLRRTCFFLIQTRTKILISPTVPLAILNRRVNKWGEWGGTCL